MRDNLNAPIADGNRFDDTIVQAIAWSHENNMQITFERDSVCAGDDVLAPNTVHLEFDRAPLVSELFAQDGPVSDYLPSVSASRTFWAAHIGTEHIADICFSYLQSPSLNATLLTSDRLLPSERIWFTYLRQELAD